MEIDSDIDEETELHDLNQLTAVLEEDEQTNDASSQFSSALSLCSGSISTQYKYSKIQYTLALNKLTDEKLRRLEGILIGRLQDCRQRLKEIEGSAQLVDKPEKPFRYSNCGKPYFRGRDNYPAPDNEDTILMAKSNMYDFSKITSVPGWTVKDKSEFLSTLHKLSIDIKRNELNSKITQLKRDAKRNPGRNFQKCIADMKEELNNLKHKRLSEVALPLNEEYDWEAIASTTNYRHTAQEYRSLWKLFLHPSITKSSWTKAEHTNLQSIAHANGFQDWEKIAESLNTGRTGYQCFVYFRTNMSNTFTGQKWSNEEEEYLKRLIEYYREDNYIPWSKITSLMENRTKIQIYNKYNRLIERRKGRFLQEEDVVILTCVKEFGTNFSKMTKYLPGRSISQLRTRYQVLAHTKGTRTSTVWTEDEDRKLLQFMANQDSTTNYSTLTQYFPGKTREHIRSRYLTLVKWMRKHPNTDIAKAPRRGARRLGHGEASQDLNIAIENLKTRIQTEVENKKSSRISKDSPEDAIETAIVATLINECILQDETRKYDKTASKLPSLRRSYAHSPISSNVKNLQKVLVLLKARLSKKVFESSIYAKKYPGLTESNVILLKSYSKKKKVQVIGINNPDIWGNSVLGASEYVFPPNYSTITGCRSLMSYVTSKTNLDHLNFGVLGKRNVILQEQLDILTDRFRDLFLWPMILSNESRQVDVTIPNNLKGKRRKRSAFYTNSNISSCEEEIESDSDDEPI